MPNADTSRRTPTATKVVAAVTVLLLVVAGVWFTGAVVSDDHKVAMAATGVFFALGFVACLLFVRSRRDLTLPVMGAFLVAATILGGWLFYESTVDDEVDEEVVVGAPRAAAAGGDEAAGGEEAGGGEERGGGNVEVASGTFSGLAHPAKGKAAVVEVAGGERMLTLTEFETDPGPDLRVYLATDEDASDFEDLGALKGNKGDQQYEIPEDVDIERYSVVLVWCRAFTVGFGKAPLQGS
jgi:hypothetical protein